MTLNAHDRRWCVAISASAMVHVALILASSAWFFAPRQATKTFAAIECNLATNDHEESAAAPIPVLTLGSMGGGTGEGMGGPRQPANVPIPASAVPFQDTALVPRLVTNPSGAAANWRREGLSDVGLAERVGPIVQGPGGIESPGGSGEGAGSGGGVGNGRGSSTFFGIRSAGRRVVYLVDASNSMNRRYEGEGKTRFGQMKLELAKSILALKEDQQFFVIFFNEHAIPMPSSGLEPAFPQNQQRFLSWVASVPADGLTDPRPAMALALQLNPDVVYLLTDGTFPRDVEFDLSALRQARTQIHTVAFGDPKAERSLKPLALRNHGRFAFVP